MRRLPIARGSSALIVALLIFSVRLANAADDFVSASLSEMSAGKTKLFKSVTVEKSSAKYEISYPESWRVAESPRSAVIARIEESTHLATANFVIGEDHLKSTDATPDELFTRNFLKKLKPSGTTLIRGERFKEGTFDGAVIEYVGEQTREEHHFRLHATAYFFVQGGTLVELQFFVFLGEKEDKPADDAAVVAFQPLWKAMLSTLKTQP